MVSVLAVICCRDQSKSWCTECTCSDHEATGINVFQGEGCFYERGVTRESQKTQKTWKISENFQTLDGGDSANVENPEDLKIFTEGGGANSESQKSQKCPKPWKISESVLTQQGGLRKL